MSRRPFLPPWSWAPLVLAVDFATKRLVLAHSDSLVERFDLIGDLARLAYVRNPGAAMGLFPSNRYVLIAVSVMLSVALVYFYRRTAAAERVKRGALAAILGGAAGNLVDRIFYGGLVVDFIDLGLGAHRFYTFNVADMGVTLGGALLFLCLLRESAPAGEANLE